MQGMGGGGNQYSQLADTLMTDHNVERTQLTEGRVPEGAEVLVVADPQQLNDKAGVRDRPVPHAGRHGDAVGLAAGADRSRNSR